MRFPTLSSPPRNYFTDIDHPKEGRSFRYPGSFIKSSASSLGPRRRAPYLGEHNEQILGNNIHPKRALRFQQANKTRPFEGLKVLDFCWVAVGPLTTRYLADHGATVVRVEVAPQSRSPSNGIPLRRWRVGNQTAAAIFANYNSNKYGISVDFSNPEAKDVIHRLVRWADVVTENFSPGTLERYGLGYDDLKKINSSIVMYSASMLGRGRALRQPGRLRPDARFPGRVRSPLRLARPNSLCHPTALTPTFFLARFGASALIAALDYRERTGQGQYLDLSQLEGALQILGPGPSRLLGQRA